MVKPKMSQVDLRGVVPGEFLYPGVGKPAQGCASGLVNAIVQRIDLLTCGWERDPLAPMLRVVLLIGMLTPPTSPACAPPEGCGPP